MHSQLGEIGGWVGWAKGLWVDDGSCGPHHNFSQAGYAQNTNVRINCLCKKSGLDRILRPVCLKS